MEIRHSLFDVAGFVKIFAYICIWTKFIQLGRGLGVVSLGIGSPVVENPHGVFPGTRYFF